MGVVIRNACPEDGLWPVVRLPRSFVNIHGTIHIIQGPGTPTWDRFVFARLRYASGDWDYNPSNVLDSLMRYTTIPVEEREVVVDLTDDALFDFPFLFMTGHQPVRLRPDVREGDGGHLPGR